jgi:hypothetical protein
MLTHALEFNGSATGDHGVWATGNLASAGSGWAISIWHQLSDRDFINPPTSGILVASCDTSQQGLSVDCGFADGCYRLAVISATSATALVEPINFPSRGLNHILINAINNGSNNYTFEWWSNGRRVFDDTRTYSGGLNVSQTTSLFGGRVDGGGPTDHLGVGSLFRASLKLSPMSPTDIANAYSDHRPQDNNFTWDSDILFGSGAGDSASVYVDQSGNSRGCSLSGAWSTGGAKQHRPPRPLGQRHSGSGNSLTGWDDFGSCTISSGAAGVTITTSSTDIRACARFIDHPIVSSTWKMRTVVRVASASAQVIGVGMTPQRTNASAVVGFVNLIVGACSIYAGEFDADFGDAEVVRSDSPSNTGTSPSGADILVDAGASNGDDYLLELSVDGFTGTFECQNLTQGTEAVRVVGEFNHEIVNSHRHTINSPGYLSVFSLVSGGGTVQVISREYIDLTVENPVWLAIGDSIDCVDQDLPTNTWHGVANTAYETDGRPEIHIVTTCGPGGQLDEVTLCDVMTGDIEALGAQRVCIRCGGNNWSDGAVTAQGALQDLQDQIASWASPPAVIMHLANPPITIGAITSDSWRTNQATVAASYTGAYVEDAGYQGTGNPVGTSSNTQFSGDFDGADPVHMADQGADRFGTALFTVDAFAISSILTGDVAESLTGAASPSAICTLVAAASDAVTGAESTSSLAAFGSATSEAVTGDATQGSAVAMECAASESGTTGCDAACVIDMPVGASESATAGEAPTASVEMPVAGSESATCDAASAAALTMPVAGAESVTGADETDAAIIQLDTTDESVTADFVSSAAWIAATAITADVALGELTTSQAALVADFVTSMGLDVELVSTMDWGAIVTESAALSAGSAGVFVALVAIGESADLDAEADGALGGAEYSAVIVEALTAAEATNAASKWIRSNSSLESRAVSVLTLRAPKSRLN